MYQEVLTMVSVLAAFIAGNNLLRNLNMYHNCNPLTEYVAVFAGHDASRALGMTSTKAEDVVPDWSPLTDKEKSVLEDWFMFFSKRYNIVGIVEGATNQ
jgi:hypothetical protein